MIDFSFRWINEKIIEKIHFKDLLKEVTIINYYIKLAYVYHELNLCEN